MLALITKASDSYWYEFKEINTLDDLLEIYPSVVVEQNRYNKDDIEFWDDFKKEDIPKMEKAKINVIIYDYWLE